MGDVQDHLDMEEATELPNVIPKCHKTPTVSEMVPTTGPIRRTGAGVNIAWQAELQTFLSDPES